MLPGNWLDLLFSSLPFEFAVLHSAKELNQSDPERWARRCLRKQNFGEKVGHIQHPKKWYIDN